MRIFNLFMVLLIIMVIEGCSSMNRLRDPAYAPVEPLPAPPREEVNGSIYHANTSRFLFEDVKARRVGDMITVLLQEATNASKKAGTNASNSAKYDLSAPTLFGRGVTNNGQDILGMNLDGGYEFAGDGDSSQSNSLKGSVTVTVTKVLSNGNLRIRGEKLLTLNQGSEVVRITGIVRPIDVTTENTVLSTQIAGAEITYSGNGFVADSSKPGLFTRFFRKIWPF